MLTLQNLGRAALGLGIASALAFGASEATAKSTADSCYTPGHFGSCSTHEECDAICAYQGLPPGGCMFLNTAGAKCCVCAI